jgi:hypothetical protein
MACPSAPESISSRSADRSADGPSARWYRKRRSATFTDRRSTAPGAGTLENIAGIIAMTNGRS